MHRRHFLQALPLLAMNLAQLHATATSYAPTPLMPVLFIGHGSPMNALEDNPFTRTLLARFRSAGTTVLIVSHNAQAIRKTCDRCVWLDAGRLRADGDPASVLAAYAGHGTDPDERSAGQLHPEPGAASEA